MLMTTDRDAARPLGTALLVASFAALVAALLVHYRFSVAGILRDVVLYPAAVCTGLLVWKRRPWEYALAAITIALPAWAFFEAAALSEPGETGRFVNHLLLLLAAGLATAGGVAGFVRKGQG